MRSDGKIVKTTSEIGFIPSAGEDKCNYKSVYTLHKQVKQQGLDLISSL